MIKNIKYTTAKESKFYPLDWNNQLEQCCGCGLVHVVNYKVVNGQLFAKFKVEKNKQRRLGEIKNKRYFAKPKQIL